MKTERRPGLIPVLRAGLQRTVREGGHLYWIDTRDLAALLEISDERDEAEARAVRAEAVVEATRAAYKVLRPETTRALLRAALDSFDAGQEGKP